jgi:hypothetical protein
VSKTFYIAPVDILVEVEEDLNADPHVIGAQTRIRRTFRRRIQVLERRVIALFLRQVKL